MTECSRVMWSHLSVVLLVLTACFVWLGLYWGSAQCAHLFMKYKKYFNQNTPRRVSNVREVFQSLLCISVQPLYFLLFLVSQLAMLLFWCSLLALINPLYACTATDKVSNSILKTVKHLAKETAPDVCIKSWWRPQAKPEVKCLKLEVRS